MISPIGSNLFDPAVSQTRGHGLTEGASQTAGVRPAGFADFSQVLSKVAGDAVASIKGAEATSIESVNGKASTQSVVEAVMSAERTLQTAVAVRDKAVAAYMELSRMAI